MESTSVTNPVTNSVTIDDKNAQPSVALSRRSLFRAGSALAFAAGATALVDERAQAQETAPHPAMRSPELAQISAVLDAGEPAVPNVAVIAFTRMAFGATPGDWAAFKALGATDEERLTAYVDQQLNPSS